MFAQDDRLPSQPRQGGPKPAEGSRQQQMSQTVQQTGGQLSSDQIRSDKTLYFITTVHFTLW